MTHEAIGIFWNGIRRFIMLKGTFEQECSISDKVFYFSMFRRRLMHPTEGGAVSWGLVTLGVIYWFVFWFNLISWMPPWPLATICLLIASPPDHQLLNSPFLELTALGVIPCHSTNIPAWPTQIFIKFYTFKHSYAKRNIVQKFSY